MKHGLYKTILIFFILGFLVTGLYAQMDDLYGDDGEYRMGMHSGNLFRITFFNDGTWGGHPSRPGEIGGEWPINSGHIYLMDGNIFVGS